MKTRRYNRKNKGKKKGGVYSTGTLKIKTITPSPLRRGYSASTGRNDEFVVEDIDNYFLLLKESGVLGGHDYYNGFQREHDGVINAVTSFSVSHGLQLRAELPDWWIEKSENG